MVYICDAIMGSGKSSAAINFMNAHPEKKFVYVTPYKSETERIQNACPQLKFARPSKMFEEYGYTKTGHTAALLGEGRNVATTHQGFREFTEEMKQSIRDNEYTIIIDENVSMLESVVYDEADLRMAIDADRIREEDGVYVKGGKEYKGYLHKRMISLLDSRKLVSVPCDDGEELFFWTMPLDLISCFKDVYVLTYMFKAQSLRFMLDIGGVEYQNIFVRNERGTYEFTDTSGWMPEYVKHIKDKIHIFDNKKMNNIGNRETALSIRWMKNNPDSVKKLKNAIYNYFNNYMRDIPADKRMWGTYKSSENKLKGHGYTKGFLPFNIRAKNEYADKSVLAYAVNVYMNVTQKTFFEMNGVKITSEVEDMYALSTMVQWIWRSAIRNGEEIYIYIPSRRMRTLLINWMDDLANSAASPVEEK